MLRTSSLRPAATALSIWLILAPAALAAVEVWPDCLPRAAVGSSYAVSFSATGGVAPYTFAITAGSIPPWMNLTPPLTLSGVPPLPGSHAFQVTATDSLGASGFRDYVLVVEEMWDVLVGDGLGRVRIFTRSGATTPVSFPPYGASYPINVASGNIDGGATWEILTAPAGGAVYGPHVRAFQADGTALAKVSFYAYGTLRYGANLASGNIDGDAYDEIVTAPGPGTVFGPHIRGWNFDGVAISAISKVNFFAYGTLQYGANVSTGNTDGDCFDELVTGAGPGAVFGPTVRVFDYDGVQVTATASFNAFAALNYGVTVDSGDVDWDLRDDVVAAPGPGPSNPARFLGFDVDGGLVTLLAGYDTTPFTTSYGAEPGIAELGDPAAMLGGEDLLAAPGRDPAAAGEVETFAYTGSALLPAWTTPLFLSPMPLSLAGGKLGY